MLTVVFDLDGTLADTSGDLLAAANACFTEMGHGAVLERSRDRNVALRGGRAMLTAGFARLGQADMGTEIDRWYPRLLDAYATAIDRHTVLYPGALAAVRQLAAAGHPVAICTNKPEALARLLLERLGILGEFGALIGADTLPVRKPDPEPLRQAVRRAGGDPARCALVGDTLTDHRTARAAGAFSVLVTFDDPAGQLAQLEPDALVARYADLPPVVAALAGGDAAALQEGRG